MPELPEVEVVRAGLLPAVSGARVAAVTVRDERALTRHTRSSDAFERELVGAAFDAPARRGKFLWIPLRGTDRALIGHLGMSGQLLLRSPDAPPERHERIRLDIDHPVHGELSVVFADQRTFGSLAVDDLVATPDGDPAGWGTERSAIPSQVVHIARDPLDPHFSDERFFDALARKASGVKRVLLDQTTVSGIGNIYADESLWAARIHPETRAADLRRADGILLLQEIRLVLQKALAEGGTSFDAQYVNVNGQAGYFAHSLNAYGRAGVPCPRCGTPIIRERFMNRGSHHCPTCQRLRRTPRRT